MYCVEFCSYNNLGTGFIRPYNAVRDEETYSLTYIVPSMLDGIISEHELEGKILRHKLTFNGMGKEFVKGGDIQYCKKKNTMPQNRHCLLNPKLILAFELKKDAEQMLQESIYIGQKEYTIIPRGDVKIYSEEDFDKLPGVETFLQSTVDYSSMIFCGYNRFKDNEPMFIKIKRNEWN